MTIKTLGEQMFHEIADMIDTQGGRVAALPRKVQSMNGDLIRQTVDHYFEQVQSTIAALNPLSDSTNVPASTEDYEATVAICRLLGKDDVAELLEQTLNGGKRTDELWTEIAMTEIHLPLAA